MARRGGTIRQRIRGRSQRGEAAALRREAEKGLARQVAEIPSLREGLEVRRIGEHGVGTQLDARHERADAVEHAHRLVKGAWYAGDGVMGGGIRPEERGVDALDATKASELHVAEVIERTHIPRDLDARELQPRRLAKELGGIGVAEGSGRGDAQHASPHLRSLHHANAHVARRLWGRRTRAIAERGIGDARGRTEDEAQALGWRVAPYRDLGIARQGRKARGEAHVPHAALGEPTTTRRRVDVATFERGGGEGCPG